ncbi:MAG: VTT domain-containing protein [Bacillota bacterium]
MKKEEIIDLPFFRIGASAAILLFITIASKLLIDWWGGVEKIQTLIGKSGSWGPAIFIVLKAPTYVIAPLSGTPLKISAGVLFGFRNGVIFNLLGELLGGSINFWLARSFGRKVITKLIGKTGTLYVDSLAQQLGQWRKLLLVRIFLTPIYDFGSYAVGLSELPYYQYCLVSVFGGLISVSLLTALGAGLGESTSSFLILAFSAAAIIASIGLVGHYLQRKILD